MRAQQGGPREEVSGQVRDLEPTAVMTTLTRAHCSRALANKMSGGTQNQRMKVKVRSMGPSMRSGSLSFAKRRRHCQADDRAWAENDYQSALADRLIGCPVGATGEQDSREHRQT